MIKSDLVRKVILYALFFVAFVFSLVAGATYNGDVEHLRLIAGLLIWCWGALAILFRFFPTSSYKSTFENSSAENYTATTLVDETKVDKATGIEYTEKVAYHRDASGCLRMNFLIFKVYDKFGRSIMWWRITYALIITLFTGLIASNYFKSLISMLGETPTGALASINNVLGTVSFVVFLLSVATFAVRFIYGLTKR